MSNGKVLYMRGGTAPLLRLRQDRPPNHHPLHMVKNLSFRAGFDLMMIAVLTGRAVFVSTRVAEL